jgi:hypothetical protein
VTARAQPGAIHIGVALDDAGRVTDVRLRSGRPVGVARLFTGRPAAEAPSLAGSLFSLCGFSHRVAARRALAAAQGAAAEPSRAESVGLAAERLAESLRATLFSWPERAGDARIAAPLRDAVAAARTLTRASADEAAAARLESAVATLGLRSDTPAAPAPGSVFAEILAEAGAETFLRALPPDPLTPADDPTVVDALRSGREAFAAAPSLPARVVETGAFARHGGETGGPALAARLVARFLDMAEALRLLRSGEDFDGAAASTGQDAGFAAVESARGRLYHWARLGADGRVVDYQILAPTEWNFHPAGPFVAALAGARVGAGAAASRRVALAAALYDPCVAFEIALREPDDA